ncbi:MAG: YkvA family protein [Caldilineaceae bacterium]|nr:YkvA family protein [Caldilineaceae bacterium]
MTRNPSFASQSGGWRFSDILRDFAVVWQLMGDPQVPVLLRLGLPAFAILYLISPIDLLVGPVDDIAVILLASRVFVQLAPHAAVRRALIRLGRIPPDEPDREVWDIWDEDDKTIPGEWRTIDD